MAVLSVWGPWLAQMEKEMSVWHDIHVVEYMLNENNATWILHNIDDYEQVQVLADKQQKWR